MNFYFKSALKIIFTKIIIANDFFDKTSFEIILSYNMLEIIFIIKIHWKFFFKVKMHCK